MIMAAPVKPAFVHCCSLGRSSIALHVTPRLAPTESVYGNHDMVALAP